MYDGIWDMLASRRFLVAVSAAMALLFGCSKSSTTSSAPPTTPTSPSPDPSIPNLAGTWTGTIESTVFAARPIGALMIQSADCVDGSWQTVPSEWNGAISGFAQPSSFSGFISFDGSPNGSGLCQTVVRASGSATATAIKWTAAFDGNCDGGRAQTVTFVLRKN